MGHRSCGSRRPGEYYFRTKFPRTDTSTVEISLPRNPPVEISSTITLSDGQEIVFGRGDPNGQVIDKPNPEYCNIKLAIARAMHACGAADINLRNGLGRRGDYQPACLFRWPFRSRWHSFPWKIDSWVSFHEPEITVVWSGICVFWQP